MLHLTLILAAAAARPVPPDLPTVARDHGPRAALEALQQVVADAKKPKLLDRALVEARLDQVAIPVRLGFGAELTLSEPGPLTGCTWGDGELTCTVRARATGPARPEDYQLTCRTSYGAARPMVAEPSTDGDALVWRLREVEACWELDAGHLLLSPVSHDDLEGVGQGTDLIPPELTALSWQEAEAIIADRLTQFRYCYQRYEDGPTGTGTLVVRYHIGEDGHIDVAEVDSATFDDSRVVECILGRFERLRFPPPMGGWEGGTYPFTFQR